MGLRHVSVTGIDRARALAALVVVAMALTGLAA